MLPKVSAAEDTEGCRQAMRAASLPPDLPVVPIIETARGVLTVREIAAAAAVECVALGRFDLAADLAIDPDGGSPAFAAARAAVVLASRAEGLLQPLDSPWITIKDLDGLGAAAARARADGFGGMLLIHPSHIGMVNQVFAPTAEELDWARRIIESAEQAGAAGRGAYAMDGAMVDEAIIKRARAILEESG
jgi:citrate lyase beta subunit